MGRVAGDSDRARGDTSRTRKEPHTVKGDRERERERERERKRERLDPLSGGLIKSSG